MIANTLGHIQHTESNSFGIGFLNALKSLFDAMRTTPRPIVLLEESAVTPEVVEARLRRPAWRHMGRYL